MKKRMMLLQIVVFSCLFFIVRVSGSDAASADDGKEVEKKDKMTRRQYLEKLLSQSEPTKEARRFAVHKIRMLREELEKLKRIDEAIELISRPELPLFSSTGTFVRMMPCAVYKYDFGDDLEKTRIELDNLLAPRRDREAEEDRSVVAYKGPKGESVRMQLPNGNVYEHPRSPDVYWFKRGAQLLEVGPGRATLINFKSFTKHHMIKINQDIEASLLGTGGRDFNFVSIDVNYLEILPFVHDTEAIGLLDEAGSARSEEDIA